METPYNSIEKLFKGEFTVIGGPCAVESREQLLQTVQAIRPSIDILRGGAFKPRTKPESFQGLGEEGLVILAEAKNEFHVPVITEVMDTRQVETVAKYADIVQVGARNMQNYELLRELSKIKKPVMLKRGFAATVEEWLSSASYLAAGGNRQIILCERGIRTFETATRFTLDLAGALVAKQKSGYPVIVDPSHATGDKKLIGPLSRAAKAAGFDGIMIEVHYRPAEALCDKEQALMPEEFVDIIKQIS